MVYIDNDHMIADTETELEIMARKLDLKPGEKRLDGRYRIPHYLVTERLQTKAIELGAKIITRRELKWYT